MIEPKHIPKPEKDTGPDLKLVENGPDGAFFDLETIRFRPGLNETKKFDGGQAALVIFGIAEADKREEDPNEYTKQFADRYQRAVAKRFAFREGDEERYRLVLDEKGDQVKIPIPLSTLPDINDFAFDVYDQLEATGSPLITVLEQVGKQQILVGDEYASTLRMCMLIASEGLPATTD